MQSTLAELGQARVPRRVVKDGARNGAWGVARRVGGRSEVCLQTLGDVLHGGKGGAVLVALVSKTRVLGTVAGLLGGGEVRELGRGHLTRELKGALKGAKAAAEVGQVRGTEGTEGGRGHWAIAPSNGQSRRRTEGGVVRKGGPPGVAV